MGCKRYWALTGIALTVLSAQGMAMAETGTPAPAAASATGGTQADQPVFATDQIEQMLAPIALYPDALLAQVLMAATYPLEIVQASRWVKKNPDLKDEALDAALREEPWDPSVKTLVMFPDVLRRMNDNLDWTQDLGDAFLAQEGDVMDAVQRLRREAQRAGALKDTPQQKVVVEKETIVVETADPQIVYVPTYDPSVVYGTPPPATQYYPTVYQQPVYTTSATDQWVSFGTGALVGGLLTAAIMWDDDDDDWYDGWGYRHHVWHHGPGYWDDDWRGPRYGSGNWNHWRGDVNIDGDVCIGRCINIDRNEWKKQARTFEHRPEHRGGVRYKDWQNVAARHPDVATALPAKPNQRPGLAGVGDRPGFRPRPPERPDLARPDRPAIATRPALKPDRPGKLPERPGRPGLGGDNDRPSIGSRPGKLPERPDRPGVSGDQDRPSIGSRPGKLPDRPGAGGDSGKRPGVTTRPAERPKPETRPAQRPTTGEARPAKQPTPSTREVRRAPESTKATAFQKRDTATIERKASQRGASSRGKATAQTRAFTPPKASTQSVTRSPQGSRGTAFQSRGSGKMERKASQRGASSRGKFSGGGGGRGVGGKRGR
jgi:uncharacterized membrane protein YgcG